MRMRAFGRTGLEVSEFGIGCARIGGIFQADTSGFLDLFAAARDSGINFFDTADMYSQGESEALLGRAFRGVRSRVIIASKAGYCLPGRRRLAARLKPLLRPALSFLGIRRESLPSFSRGKPTQDFSPAYLRAAVEGSLKRLRTDYLDVFQLHSPPLDVIERGEWVSTLDDIKRAGKVRYYGIACDNVGDGLAALRYPDVSSIQITLNLLDRRASQSLLPRMREGGVAGIARECLANGLLAKPLANVDLASYVSPDQLALRQEQLAEVHRDAEKSGRPVASRALEYVAAADGVSVSLLGVRTVAQLQGLLALIAR